MVDLKSNNKLRLLLGLILALKDSVEGAFLQGKLFHLDFTIYNSSNNMCSSVTSIVVSKADGTMRLFIILF